jgi:hypothetical protein
MTQHGTASRKAKITAEHRNEARLLKAIWDAQPHDSQAEFGEKYEIGNQSAVGQFLRADAPLSMKAARGFAKGLGCQISAFSPRLATLAEEVSAAINPYLAAFSFVPHAYVTVSAGHGAVVLDEGLHSSLSFHRDYLQAQGVSEKNAVVVQVKGRSMEPTIDDGSVLLINRSYQEVRDGLIYAFRHDGELFVKRMHRSGADLLAGADNPDREQYPDMLISAKDSDFEMIGRAVWMGKKL